MKNRTGLLAISLCLLATAALAQVGGIDGIVYLPHRAGPAVGATVTAFSSMHRDSFVTVTDERGHYALDPLPVGMYMVRATLPGHLPAVGQAPVREGYTFHLDLMLGVQPTGTGSIAGVVWLPHRAGPAVGATVTAFRSRVDSLVTTTDERGHFIFPNLPVGMYHVRATLEGFVPAFAQVGVRDGETARIELMLGIEPTGTGNIAGVVLLPRREGPAVGATVTAFRTRNDSIVTTTDEQGRFAFNGIPVGMYRVRATLEGFVPAFAQVGVRDGQTARVRLVLRPLPGPAGVVEGLVTLPDETPVAGAHVMLMGENRRCQYRTVTDEQGNFAFPRVRPGHYRIAAASREHGFASAEIDVVAGQATQVTLVLEERPGGGQLSMDDFEPGNDPKALAATELTASNYPNPFNPATTIHYSVPQAGDVKLVVFDITGRKVAELVNQYQAAGNYAVTFDGRDLPSGTYIYRLSTGNLVTTQRMILLK